jgi:uncharacterized protein YjcR
MNNTHPTPSQAEWLKNNFMFFKNAELAEKLGVTENKVTNWLLSLGLRKRKAKRKLGAIVKKKVNLGPEPTITRLKADHQNMSREQHIERILKIEL